MLQPDWQVADVLLGVTGVTVGVVVVWSVRLRETDLAILDGGLLGGRTERGCERKHENSDIVTRVSCVLRIAPHSKAPCNRSFPPA